MDGVEGRIAAKDTIHCGNVAVQDCSTGGAGGGGRKRKGSFLLLHLKWEGGLQWANFRCEEQKARFSTYTVTLPFSRYWLDDEVSSWSPTEFHFDSPGLLVGFILQIQKARHSLLCTRQLNWAMSCICTWWPFRSISSPYNQTRVRPYNQHVSYVHSKSSITYKNKNLWSMNINIA